MSENEKNDSMPEITGHLTLDVATENSLASARALNRMAHAFCAEPLASPESFRESGLLKQVNDLLRPYGWGIAFVMGEDGTVASIQPVTIPVVLETELAALAAEDQERVARLERLTVPD